MRRLARLGLVVCAAAVACALPASAAADPSITVTCNGTACSTGWYTADIQVIFTLPAGATNPQGCGNEDVTSDTTGSTFTCTVQVPNTQCCILPVTIKRDATPPTATISPARAADSSGWYNHPLSFSLSGSDATSGIQSCTTIPTYSGPDSATASVSGTCTDNAGNVTTRTLPFQYDAGPPSVSAQAGRSPDSNGWYNHPVAVSFGGTDSVSGIASCTSTTTYSGPDSGSASVPGQCTDKAGNTGSASFPLKYDASAPSVSGQAGRTPDSNGWYDHPVGVTFTGSSISGIASCSSTTYSGPDDGSASVSGSCTDNAGNTASGSYALKYDSTPPTASPISAARGPDSNGWYNHPVAFSLTGSDSLSGVASCTTTTYSGPDSGSASVTGTCTDKAGNVSAAQTLGFQYDAGPPTIAAHADRSPDANGWYDHAVGVSFTGSDPVSGIASCTPSTSYAGPDSGSASVSGTCTDKAGNSASSSYRLKYDSNPPTLTALTAEPLDGGASLTWKASMDAVAVTVTRAAGKKAAAIVYSGKPRPSWRDTKLRNGVAYTYTVTAVDAAGYAVVRHATVRPSAPLLAPPAAARVQGATTLRWRPSRKAAYYNVQLWHRGAKVLSAWPSGPRFRLGRTWKYLGRPQRLRPGSYFWYVWPGLGPRAKHRYGALIGKSRFVVSP